MTDLLGWMIRTFGPSSSARCTACGRKANGRVLYGPIPEDAATAIVCEHCGKRWNISVLFEDGDDPYDREPEPCSRCDQRTYGGGLCRDCLGEAETH